MSYYTPSTEEVRSKFAGDENAIYFANDEGRAEFDRWLAATIQQAKAEALREAAEALEADTYGPDDGTCVMCGFHECEHRSAAEFEGFGQNWTDDGKQVYALAIGEAQDALRDRADRIASGNPR